jgi:hypothetical protein
MSLEQHRSSAPGVLGLALRAQAALACALMGASMCSAAHAQPICLNPSAPLTVEEARLTRVLPGHTLSTPEELLQGAEMDQLGPNFAAGLCALADIDSAQAYMQAQGQLLWQRAVSRAQGRAPAGTLPRSDDRPLYWARLQMEAALSEWQPSFSLSADQLTALEHTFVEWSRGEREISFPTDRAVKRIVMSGFDPFTLDAGPNGNGIRTGNPSGATILSLDGTHFQTADGNTAVIHTYILPVNYVPFEGGMQENTIGPFLLPGPQQVDASITMSQGGTSVEYDLEQWNGRYHGPSAGNDNVAVCPRIIVDGARQYQLPATGQCDIDPPQQWVPHPVTWTRDQPPQFTTTSLPISSMIAAGTGNGIAPPPSDAWTGLGAFNVVWHTNFTEFPDCNVPTVVNVNVPVPTTFPPPTQPTPPDPAACAESGGGGDYLSNESAYRNTLLRDTFGLHIFAGHIHTPIMSHFDPSNLYNVTDPTFEAWRAAIVAQGRNLVFTVANSVPSKQ